MGNRAMVETERGEIFCLLLEAHTSRGKLLLNFLIPLIVYCNDKQGEGDGSSSDVAAWVTQIEQRQNICFCALFHNLQHAFYSGDWRYREDEYAVFVCRYGDSVLSELDFKKAIRDIQEKWTDVGALLHDVNQIIRALEQARPPDTWFYTHRDTLSDIQALYATLQLAHQRGAEYVRIRFEP